MEGMTGSNVRLRIVGRTTAVQHKDVPLGRQKEEVVSVITISRGSHSHGKEIAEKVAQSLGFECISREILLEASEKFNIPEIKLERAIHDAPSILERFTYGKERYIAYMRAAVLKHLQKDNVVYHGLAGHFFLEGIPHVLKVRIIADIEDRIREEMTREKISADEVRYILRKDDDERRKWGLYMYGKDTWDASLYDMVLHIQTMTVEEAAQIIITASRMESYRTTPQSQRLLDDLCLAAQVEAALVNEFNIDRVIAREGSVHVAVITPPNREEETQSRVSDIAQRVEGVKEVTVDIVGPILTVD
jgi:cytidylate kinase